jgi:hypothetical protein
LVFGASGMDMPSSLVPRLSSWQWICKSYIPNGQPEPAEMDFYFSVGTLLVLFQIMRSMNIQRLPALTGCIALALSYTYWSQSMTIEAYALNNLIFASYTSLAIKDLIKQERRHTIHVGILLGLGILTHIQNILSLPFFLFYLFTDAKNHFKLQIPKTKISLTAGFNSLISLFTVLAAFFILLIPSLFYNAFPPEVIFFDFRFRDEVLAFAPQTWLRGTLLGSMYAIYNFTILLPLVFLGMYRLYKANKSLFLNWIILLLPYLVFALRYDIPDVYVYYLIPYVIAAVFLSYGLNSFQWHKTKILTVMAVFMVFQPVFYKSVTKYAHHIEYLEQYGEPKAYKGGYSYYFWPGRRNAPDPLERTLNLYQKGDPEIIRKEAEEWNVMRAWEYLYLKGEIKKPFE